jgi:hypothetical protein
MVDATDVAVPPVAADPGAPRITKLFVPGNSYGVGQNEVAAGTGNRIPTVMAGLIGATETNIAVGSSSLCNDNGSNRASATWPTSGGWVTMFTNALLKPARTRASQLLSQLQVVAMMHNGFNDMSLIGAPGNTVATQPAAGGVFDNTYPRALRAAIARLRCGHYGYNWNGSDGGTTGGVVTYDVNFTKAVNVTVSSTGQAVFASVIGSTLTLTLPSWYPGGLAVDLFFVSSNTNNGTWTIAVDGVTHGTHDTTTAIPTVGSNPEHMPTNYRIPGTALAAGSRVITATIATNNGGGQYFDCWTIEAMVPPLIVIDKQPRVPAGTYPSPPGNLASNQPVNYNWTEADIIALNQRLDVAASEWLDGRVIAVDTDPLGGTLASNFQADNVHPAANFCGQIGGAMATAALNYYAAHPGELAMLGKG